MSQQGTYIPLITPLEDSGRVCERSVSQLLDATRDWVAGFIPCLTSGEGWRLTSAHWLDMVRYTLRHAGDREIVVGIEKPTTREVLSLAHQAEDMGVDAVILTTPFGRTVSQENMLQHFRSIHDSTNLNLFIYNESALSGNQCHLNTLLAIADLQRVTGIKDSCEERRGNEEISALQRCGVSYYLGWEDRLVGQPAVDGNIVSLSNLDPAICREAMSSDDTELQHRIDKLCDTYSLLADDWYYHVKLELKRRGIIKTAQTVGA